MPKSARHTVLAVEDDPVIRKAIERALASTVDVVFAPTGKDALAALPAHVEPAFVLLDYMLPDMDGLQVLANLRAAPRTRLTPVVIFSSLADPQRVRAALAQGANSWVRKTDDPDDFQETVQAVCRYWTELHAKA